MKEKLKIIIYSLLAMMLIIISGFVIAIGAGIYNFIQF